MYCRINLTDRASTIPSNSMDANPARGHKEVPRSTGHIMVTTRYSDQQRSKSRSKVCDSTNNGTDQYQNGSSNLLTPYREQPRSTRIVVAYPRSAFSATKRTNYAPSFSRPHIVQKEGRCQTFFFFFPDPEREWPPCKVVFSGWKQQQQLCKRPLTITILLTMYYSVLRFFYVWWLCMVINISVQYNGGFLPDIILLTQGSTIGETV